MIDIHSHILPGVDDGSENMAESLEMARMYIENGFKKVIATPHYIEGEVNSGKDKNKRVLEELKEELLSNNLDLEVYLGNEIYTTMNMMDFLENKKAASLNDSKYILIEFPMYDIPLYIDNLIYEIQLGGYVPIIAHPERNSKIIEDPNILYNFIKKGALGQLNLPSIEDMYGSKIKATGEILLENKMIHFLGTDSHSKGNRSPAVGNSLERVREIVGRGKFREISRLNAESVLKNKQLEVEAPVEYRKSRGLFGFFKRKKK